MKSLPSPAIVVFVLKVPPNTTSSPEILKPLEVLTFKVTSPSVPPPVKPAPATTDEISPSSKIHLKFVPSVDNTYPAVAPPNCPVFNLETCKDESITSAVTESPAVTVKSIVVPSTKLASSKTAVSAAASKSVTCDEVILIKVVPAAVN